MPPIDENGGLEYVHRQRDEQATESIPADLLDEIEREGEEYNGRSTDRLSLPVF